MTIVENEIPAVNGAVQSSGRRRMWTRDEYYKMAAAGIFGADERVELIRGEVVTLAPIGPSHRRSSLRLYDILHDMSAGSYYVLHESPITLTDGTEPQPDIAVARGSEDDYDDRHPYASEIVLVVEASDTTLAADRRDKAQLYAAAGIPNYWIINLVQGQAEVYDLPVNGQYSRTAFFLPTQKIDVPFLSGKSIGVSDILPRNFTVQR